MNDQYRLVSLGNSQLVAGLAELARQSHALTGQLLAHLAELEARRLHLELGFSSLFSYCVEALGMSEGAAGRRVTAARVCKRFPELFERVARGEIHLCALCALAPHLNSDNARELFQVSRGKTRRQVEELLAARFPRPDFREQIRRLPVRAPTAVPANAVQGQSRAGRAEAVLSEKRPEIAANPSLRPQSSPPLSGPTTNVRGRHQRELEPLAVDRFGVRFTADGELRELIERARALASHRLPNDDLASLIKLMARTFVQQEERRRFGIGGRSRKSTRRRPVVAEPTPPGGAAESPSQLEVTRPRSSADRAEPHQMATRYVPMAARREVHERDGGRCSFISADGRRCNARARLELDHLTPFALRGTADAQNLRLLCKAHNQLHARRCFGSLHIAAKIAAREHRGRGSG